MKIRTKTKQQDIFDKELFKYPFFFGLSRLLFKYKSVHKSQATRLIWFGFCKKENNFWIKICKIAEQQD